MFQEQKNNLVDIYDPSNHGWKRRAKRAMQEKDAFQDLSALHEAFERSYFFYREKYVYQ